MTTIPSTQKPSPATIASLLPRFRPSKLFTPPSPSPSPTPTSTYTSLDFSTCGRHLITTTTSETLELYDCLSGTHQKTLYSKKYGSHLARFTHNPANVIYSSTKSDDTIRYLSLHDHTYIRYFRGHKKFVSHLEVCPTDDQFISCSYDDTVKLWDLRSQHCHGSVGLKSPTLAAFDPNGLVFAVACHAAGSIMLYDIRNYDKAPFSTFHISDDAYLSAYSYPPRMPAWQSLSFSNDSKHLLLGTRGLDHYVIDSFAENTSRFLWRLHRKRAPQSSGDSVLGGVMGDVCWSPDGRWVIGGQGGGGLACWDVQRGGDEKRSVGVTWELGAGGGEKKGGEKGGNNAVVGFNPRLNLVASAEKELVFWIPEQHAPDPPEDKGATGGTGGSGGAR